MAGQVLMSVSVVHTNRDENERARLESEYKYQMDMQSKLVTAKREGILEGKLEGKIEGRHEGKIDGKLERDKEILEMISQVSSLDELKQHLAKA